MTSIWSSLLTMFVYLISVSLSFIFCSPFMFWVAMEINLVSFICLMSLSNESFSKKMIEHRIYYFCIQSMGSILFLFAIYETTPYKMMNLYLVLALLLKLGLSPFHFWMMKFSNNLTKLSFIIFATIQKLPLFYYCFSMMSSDLMSLIHMNMVSGVWLMTMSNNINTMLLASGIYSAYWMGIMFSISQNLFFFMFALYYISVPYLYKAKSKNSKTSSLISALMMTTGLPPFALFFFKIIILSEVTLVVDTSIFILWTMSFSALMIYFLFFLSYFFNMKLNYTRKMQSSSFLIFLSFSVLFLL